MLDWIPVTSYPVISMIPALIFLIQPWSEQ